MAEYIPLALKLRPTNFNDFIYNEPIVSILESMIINNKLPNGIIFSGTRGIGKTTLARIFARSLICEKKKKKSAEPCGKCSNCKESLEGRHPDIIEIDGATHGNIDDIRRILEQAQHTPMVSDKKIFIVDEAHNLGRSAASWDSLLKMLEEPPEHVMWVFCTTAKHKIPDTIKSRLVSLDLRMVPTSVLDNYLGGIMMKEWEVNKNGQDEVAPTVALAANNSIRDALTLLEKIAPYCNEKSKGWSKRYALEALGSFDMLKTPELLELIVGHNSAGLWAMFNSVIESGVEPEPLFEAVSTVVNNIMTLYLGGIIPDPNPYIPHMEHFEPARIIYMCDTVFKRSRDLYSSSNKKMVLQVLAMELCG